MVGCVSRVRFSSSCVPPSIFATTPGAMPSARSNSFFYFGDVLHVGRHAGHLRALPREQEGYSSHLTPSIISSALLITS